MKVLNLLASGRSGGIETLCNNIDKYGNIDNFWVFLFDGGKIADEMNTRNPNKVYILKYNKYKLFKFIRKITDICKKNKIDIINIHHGGTYCNLLFTALKKYNKDIKFVRTLHSCYEDKYNLSKNFISNKLNLYYLNKALQESDLIVCVSKAVMKTYENKFNIRNKKRVVIYNGIDNIFLKDSNREYDSNRKNHLIYVGRIEKVKGIDILIDAFSILYKNHKEIDLTIVGTGSQYETLKEKCKYLKINDKVFFIGEKTSVKDYLDKSEIFIYPSIWEEAFGISVVEAMARDCIPITFNKGGLLEIITNNKNGFLVNEVSIDKLANTIEEVINMDENKRRLIVNNTNETAKKFTVNNTIKELEKEYNNLVNANDN